GARTRCRRRPRYRGRPVLRARRAGNPLPVPEAKSCQGARPEGRRATAPPPGPPVETRRGARGSARPRPLWPWFERPDRRLSVAQTLLLGPGPDRLATAP